MYKRRDFLINGLKAGSLLSLTPYMLASCGKSVKEGQQENESSKKLKILILGGTSFLGPHQIAYAMERGHSITTFTRGKTKPTVHQDLFANVESLVGDRSNNLEALHNRQWDAVIDNSGHNANWTRDSAKLLKDSASIYMYTSSTGVYYPYLGSNIREDTKLLLEEPEGIEDEEMKIEYWYGVMKTNSEIAARNNFGEDRTIVIRPTYMIGPADKSDRFIHWPIRLSRGGDVVVPGKPEDPVQYMDVRDVAHWMIRLIEKNAVGTYNAVGPASPTGMRSFVEEVATAFTTESNLVQVHDYEFLERQNIHHLVPWIMPVGNNVGSALANNELAIANGLTFTPLSKTVKDTHDWWYSDALSQERRDRFEADPETVLAREEKLLEDWASWQANS